MNQLLNKSNMPKIGEEPLELLKQVHIMIERLNDTFPNKIVTGLRTKHKDLLSLLSPLYLNLGFKNISSMLEFYGFKYVPSIIESNKESDPINKQIRLVEPVMAVTLSSYNRPVLLSDEIEALLPILTEAFLRQPLIGNIIISDDIKEKLFLRARKALEKMLASPNKPPFGLSLMDCDFLVLETVILLRDWNDVDAEDDNPTTLNFWEYICDQYALRYDNNFSGSTTYRAFRYAIKQSLKRHNRLFISTGHSYYTSLLIHALSPKQAFFGLFEQILAFYAKTLSYQYNENDKAFLAFSNGFYSWINQGASSSTENVHIKSIQSSSAIKALFSNCPLYMASLVESIVSSIDSLIARGNLTEKNYLDSLINVWFSSRSNEDQKRDRQRKRENIQDRVTTDYSQIRVIYKKHQEQVGLSIPKIRLEDTLPTTPEVRIYRSPEDQEPFTTELLTYGDLVHTTFKKDIPLDEIMLDTAKRFQLRVVIEHGGEIIYDSEERLYREAIILNNLGDEIRKRREDDYFDLFVPKQAEIDGLETALDVVESDIPYAAAYHILFGQDTMIYVNKVNLFPIETVMGDFTISSNTQPFTYCKYVVQNMEYNVFHKQSSIKVTTNNAENARRYKIYVDDKPVFSENTDNTSDLLVNIDLPDSHGIHEFKIMDILSGKTAYTLNYIVLEQFSMQFNGFYYNDQYNHNGSLSIEYIDSVTEYDYRIDSEGKVMQIPFEEGELAIDIPYFDAELDGFQESILHQSKIWHEDLSDNSLVKITPPRGFTTRINLGRDFFENNRLPIGNLVRIRSGVKEEELNIRLHGNDGQHYNIKLLDVVYQAHFIDNPIFWENGEIKWIYEENFIGNPQSKFKIDVYHKEELIHTQEVPNKNSVLPELSHLDDGLYSYIIYMKSPGFFSTFEKLSNHIYVVGDPNQFRFDDQSIIVTHAIVDEDVFELNKASGIISNIRYKGIQTLNGETISYPQYEGTLNFYHNHRWKSYSSVEVIYNGVHKEPVNPIKIWLINDYTISLRGPSNDGLHTQKEWKSITDIRPRSIMDEDNYLFADYYRFEQKKNSEILEDLYV